MSKNQDYMIMDLKGEYSDINELIRDAKLNKKNWVNQEAIKFNKKNVYEREEVKLFHIPNDLRDYKIECTNGHIFTPDWLEKRPPTTVLSDDGGYLRQTALSTQCPICSTSTLLQIPQAKIEYELEVYGDEAFRHVDNKTILVYSFVLFSGPHVRKKRFENRFNKIKKKLAPTIDPGEWVFHMKDLMSSEKRAQNEHLSHLKQNDVIQIVRELMKIIRDCTQEKSLNIYCGIGIANRDIQADKKIHIQAKSHAYNSVLMRIVRTTTLQNIIPHFYFERTNNDGWAKNLFDSARLTLLWPFITNGLPVKSPVFVEPSFSLYLEVADLISYVQARHLFTIGKMAESKNVTRSSEFNPAAFGNIMYVVTKDNGDWVPRYSDICPDDLICKGTDWELYINK